MITMNLKKIVSIGLAAALMIGVFTAEASFAGVKKYNQKGYALASYKVKNYKVVKNKYYKPLKVESSDYHTYTHLGIGIDYPHLLGTKNGNKEISLKTLFHLPKSVPVYGLDLGNPQSLSITPDGNTAYITHVTKGTKGVIIKYDLQKMRRMGLDIPGEMGELRRMIHYSYDGENAADYLSCFKVGPEFELGHGSAFAYNPKDGCLWFSSKTASYKTNLLRINMKTLKPDLCINYRMASNKNIKFGNHLTFDKNGKLYFFAYAHSKQGKCPKGAIKVYQGTINLKAKKKVKFKLMMNVIKNPIAANYRVQSAGYDPKNNRIFMVSNSAILSVPVAKLTKTKLKPADVWMTQFNVKREFEGFECDANGNYYLLVNKYPEIMTNVMPGDAFDMSLYDKYGEYIGSDDDYDDDDDDDPTWEDDDE